MSISDFFNIPDVSNTIQLVAKRIKSVQACRGQNIVVFIGREEVGKSTTINSLLGTLFQYGEENDRVLVYKSGRKPEAAMGCDERIGLMCTVFPAVYKDTKSDLYFLDTQGFFGTFKDPDESAAASILLEAAIRSASSVRIVFLEDFNEFSNGLTRINDSMNLLNNVILTDDVPLFCLFNRYLPSNRSLETFFKSDDKKRNEMIMKELYQYSEKLVKSSNDNTQQILKKIQEYQEKHLNSNSTNDENTNNSHIITDTIQNINEIKAEAEAATRTYNTFRCAQIINKNFKDNRFGYIDPTSEWSIDNLRQSIMRTPTVSKESLSFNYCDSKRANFTKDFESTLLKYITPFVNDVSFSLKFPPKTINDVLNELKQSLEKNQFMLSQINKCIKIYSSEISEITNELATPRDLNPRAHSAISVLSLISWCL